jgi:hypothetical protein
MYDSLVGAAPEQELGVPLLQNEGTVDKSVDIGEHLGEMGIRLDFFDGVSGPAPYILAGFFLDPAGKFSKTIHLTERVSSGKGDIGHGIGLDYFENLVYLHPCAVVYVPRLGVVATLAGVVAPCTVDGRTESGSVGHRLMQYFKNAELHYSWTTRSLSSASLALFHLLVVPTR